MPIDKAEWRRFSPGRRADIEKLLRTWLRARKRDRSQAEKQAAALGLDLEKWARFCARQPGERDTDLFPAEISSTARALRNALEPPMTLARIALGGRADGWRSVFEPSEWRTFSSVLATMARDARKQQRPPEKRQAFLEDKVMTVLESAGLSTEGSQYAADILAAIKEHALQIQIPPEAAARLSALRRAVKRRSPAPPARDPYLAYLEAKTEQVEAKLRQAEARLKALRSEVRKRP